MEGIQSWWEIPAVAHFCYVFRAAFNLIYFDVTELEAAILNLQDPEMSVSFEQLVTRLVQGCFEKDDVMSINLEEKLNELLEEYCETDENPLNGASLYNLTPRTKVELLLKLCQIRLDIAVSMDAIKDIPAEAMQAKCIGQDSQKYSYWYFNDERLYKENLPKTALKIGKQKAPEKGKKAGSQPIKNGNRQRAQDKKSKSLKDSNNSWSVVCHNLSDWEKLVRKFSRSKDSTEKELAKEIKVTYLPFVQEAIASKERFLRKRYLELAPKRTSSRISKVQAQKRLEEQRAAEAEEQRRREYEVELAKKEAQRKQQEIEDRRKRVEERRKIIDDRARRAQQRRMVKNFIGDYDESDCKRTLRIRSSRNQSSENTNDSDDSESEDQDVDVDSDDRSEEQSSEQEDSNKEESSGEESADESETSDHSENVDAASTNNVGKRKYEQDIIHTYDLTQWRSTISTNGQGLHLLRNTTSDITERKHFKLNEAGNYKVPPVNGCNSSPRKEVHNLQTPFQVRNYNAYNAAARQAIVRIDFIKPPNKQISS